MAITERDILTQQRHAAMEHVARTNGGMVRWIGFGFVVALTVGLYAYERTTAPRGIDAQHHFERLFKTGGESTAYDAAAKPVTRRGLVRDGEVTCRVHDGGRTDRAYDYDCVAVLKDPNGCTRYYPFYVERSSIGHIARPVNDRDARETLERFKLLGGTGC